MTARITLAVAVVLLAVIAGAGRLAVRTLIVEGNAALQRHDMSTAERLYREAIERRPASGAAYLGLGAAAYRQNRYADAAQEFQRASQRLQSVPDRLRATYNLGNALFALGRLDDALEAYQMALRLDASDEDARYNLALVWQRRENDRTPGATPMSPLRAEQLVGSLGRPQVRVSGKAAPEPRRPGPGSAPAFVDK
jgi:tetratricopeptide (TPR) repeat protein